MTPSSWRGRGSTASVSSVVAHYTQFFGTPQQPNLPARSAVQVAGLASPGVLVEIEVVLAQKGASARIAKKAAK